MKKKNYKMIKLLIIMQEKHRRLERNDRQD